MSGIKDYSTTAASNNSTPPNGAPENMDASDVNNTMRQMMADTREWYEDPEWTQRTQAITYASGTTFTTTMGNGDLYTGRRVRVEGTTTGVIYGTVVSWASGSPNTVTVAWDDAESLDNESLTLYLGAPTDDADSVTPKSPTAYAGEWVHLERHVPDGSPAGTIGDPIWFTDPINSAMWDDYRIVMRGIQTSTSTSGLRIRVSADNGSTAHTTTYVHQGMYVLSNDSTQTFWTNTTGGNWNTSTNTGLFTTGANDYLYADIEIYNLGDAVYTTAHWKLIHNNATTATYHTWGGGQHQTASAMNAIALFLNTGGFDSTGAIDLFGRRF